MYFGDVLLEVYPEMVQAARDGHGVDMHPLFDMFKAGDVDAIAGQGTATRSLPDDPQQDLDARGSATSASQRRRQRRHLLARSTS